MDFYAVLDQLLDLLRRRRRVSYKALQLQFNLDDEQLATLTEELLYACPQVVVDEGRGLRWRESAFSDIVTEVRTRLQHEKRMTYAALKHVFGLDETTLDVVRQELIFAKRVAADEHGRVLVWTGEVSSVHSPAVPHNLPPLVTASTASYTASTLPTDTPITDATDEVSGHTPMVRSPAPEAERRQVTVLFCDLVDSTRLSQQLDAEDYRAVVRAYQEAAVTAMQPWDGYVAQYLGDGLMLYFGWPTAYEDAAVRAVYASLAMVEAMAPLNASLTPRYGVRVQVRLGVHTGMAVIGEMGSGNRHEQLAMGDTPNIAARIQGVAAPDTVALSAATARLVQKAFALEELGLHTLKGVAEPTLVLRVSEALERHTDDDTITESVPFLVKRDEEVGILLRCWEQSKEGLGQVVLLSGEAGIGKSALVEVLRTHVCDQGLSRIAFRCSPYHTNSALYPVMTHLERLLRFERHETPETKLAKLEQALEPSRRQREHVVPLLAALLTIPLNDRYTPLRLSPQQQKQQTLDTLVAWLFEAAERQPVLTLWEDLHWADPSTLELLGLVIEQAPTVPMLHVLTFRPAFAPPWPTRSHLTPITLNRLERPQVEALIAHLAGGKALPTEVVEHIVTKTDGVPLFVEELTKALLEFPLLRQEGEHYALTGVLADVAIPATLQDSLMARLDQLPTAKDIAQLGAVLGREFTYEMLQALAEMEDKTLQDGLAQLVAAELLYQRGRPPRSRYIFKHALIQDVAYQSLLRSTRQQYRQRIAYVLEEHFPEIVEGQPELVAHHWTEAGLHEQAVDYWQRAGLGAMAHSAHREAITHFEQALGNLQRLSEGPQTMRRGIDLRFDLRNALLPLAEHRRIFDILQEIESLCIALGDEPRLGRVLSYMARYFVGVGNHDRAIGSSQQALALATGLGDFSLQMVARFYLGVTYHIMGDYRQAKEVLE